MNLSQLRAFLAIAREQNLTRAAASLHLTQSALSSQLKGLEESLGLPLFERSTRGMTLSRAGQTLRPYAEEVLAACATLQRRAEGLGRDAAPAVTLGLNTDPTYLRVSAINQRLSLLHPELNVIFHASETVTTAQRLKSGALDLGFFYGTLGDPEIVEQTLHTLRICVAIPSNLLASPEQPDLAGLLELPWVWVDDKFPFYQALAPRLGALNRPPQRVVTAANEQIVRELVAAGQGVALMREDEVRPLAEAGKVRIWNQGWGEVPLRLGWLRERDALRPLQKVRDVIAHIWSAGAEGSDGGLADKAWV